MSNIAKIKYVSEEIVDNKSIKRTQEITTEVGLVKIGPVWFKIPKIGPNHISINIADESSINEENQNKKARFLKEKELFGKTITIPFKSCSLNIGNWLDFTDGVTQIKHTIYINSIVCERR